MAERGFVVLDPTTAPKVVEWEMASRVDGLNGKVLGFLWNTKPNGDILLDRVEEALAQRFEFAGVTREHKRSASTPAYEGLLDRLAANCDAVINAIGD